MLRAFAYIQDIFTSQDMLFFPSACGEKCAMLYVRNGPGGKALSPDLRLILIFTSRRAQCCRICNNPPNTAEPKIHKTQITSTWSRLSWVMEKEKNWNTNIFFWTKQIIHTHIYIHTQRQTDANLLKCWRLSPASLYICSKKNSLPPKARFRILCT